MFDLKARGCRPRGDCLELEGWLSNYVKERDGFDFKMKHRREIVEFARLKFADLSTRDVAKEIFEKYGVRISNVTIYNWCSATEHCSETMYL